MCLFGEAFKKKGPFCNFILELKKPAGMTGELHVISQEILNSISEKICAFNCP
jgi:hypothetical protein